MSNAQPMLWEQLSPEQRARIIAILVQMLLQLWIQQEVQHDPSGR
jgi:uncharacterized membrane protein YhfC